MAVTSDPTAKGSAKDLEDAGPGPVHFHFPFPPISLPCVVPNVDFHLRHNGTKLQKLLIKIVTSLSKICAYVL